MVPARRSFSMFPSTLLFPSPATWFLPGNPSPRLPVLLSLLSIHRDRLKNPLSLRRSLSHYYLFSPLLPSSSTIQHFYSNFPDLISLLIILFPSLPPIPRLLLALLHSFRHPQLHSLSLNHFLFTPSGRPFPHLSFEPSPSFPLTYLFI